MRTGAKNVRARPFSHTKTDFRDWSWKEKILIKETNCFYLVLWLDIWLMSILSFHDQSLKCILL